MKFVARKAIHSRSSVARLLACAVVAMCVGVSLAQTASSDKPRRGGTLHLMFSADWRSLDPAIAFDGSSILLQKLLFRGLIDFDDSIGLIPDQAIDWNISGDGKTYTFHLRPGVRFSSGREVEAEDYVFSFERVLDPKTSSSSQTYFLDILGAKEFRDGKAAHVVGLHAPDTRTFVIDLKEPVYTFRYVLTMAAASVLPRDLVQKYGNDFQHHMAGSGPYRIARWRRDENYRFERNPYYWGNDGFVDAVEILIGGDATLNTMMLERGEMDLATATPPDVVRYLHDPLRRSWLQSIDGASTDFFFMNTEVPPFDDPRVRRAVFHAVDVERLLTLTRGFGTEASGIVPASMPWANPGLSRHAYDQGKARELLAEAGHPGGFKTQLWYRLVPAVYPRLAQGIQRDLHQVGVEVELRGATPESFYIKAGSHRQVPCGISGWSEDYPDPSDFLDVLFNGRNITDSECNNLSFYSNPEVNALLDRANRNLDAAVRTQLYREAEVSVMRDAPWVPIQYGQTPILKNPRVHGLKPHPVYLWRYEPLWLDK